MTRLFGKLKNFVLVIMDKVTLLKNSGKITFLEKDTILTDNKKNHYNN